MRRGQLDVQFNWIFVLIAGAVILGLFFKVAYTQRQVSQDKAAIRLQHDFDAITSAALQSKDTIQAIPLSKMGLVFNCDATCACDMMFGRFALSFQDRSIFAPQSVQGTEARLWVLDWKVPFRVTNFLYVTNDLTKYYIVGSASDPVVARLMAIIPDEVNIEAVGSMEAARNEGYDNAVFVTLSAAVPSPQVVARFKGADIRVVQVAENPGTAGIGTVTINRARKGKFKMEDAVKSGYAGDELLLGAIFAQDGAAYKCNARTAFMRLLGVALVYTERATSLQASHVGDSCAPIYTQIVEPQGPLAVIARDARTIVDEEPAGAALQEKINTIKEAGLTLQRLNEQLLRQSCPTVY